MSNTSHKKLIERYSFFQNILILRKDANEYKYVLGFYLVFKFIGVLVLFLVEVNEIVCNTVLWFGIHFPWNLEWVTSNIAYFDVMWYRKFFHLCYATILWFVPCAKTMQREFLVDFFSVFKAISCVHISELNYLISKSEISSCLWSHLSVNDSKWHLQGHITNKKQTWISSYHLCIFSLLAQFLLSQMKRKKYDIPVFLTYEGIALHQQFHVRSLKRPFFLHDQSILLWTNIRCFKLDDVRNVDNKTQIKEILLLKNVWGISDGL